MNYKAYKVKLHPNNKQHTKMLNIGFTNIALYNCLCYLFVDQHNKKNKQTNIFKYPNVYDLRKTFTIVKEHLIGDTSKSLPDYGIKMFEYMSNYFKNRNYDIYSISNDTLKQTIKDFDAAMKFYFKHNKKAPNMKKITLSNIGFYVDPYKIEISSNHVKLEKLVNSYKSNRLELNRVKLAEVNRIPYSTNNKTIKYYNPRVKFDGISWWLCVTTEDLNQTINENIEHNDYNIGIDMGIKQTTLSNGTKFDSINKTKYIKLLEKRLKRLQRSYSRKVRMNNRVTSNAKKDLKQIRKIQIKLTCLRHSQQEKIINTIKKLNPKKVIIENLDIKHMMKNKHLAKKIANEQMYRLRLKIKELCDKKRIMLIIADRFYPSSKKCSSCGNIKKDLKLIDRIYKCECCGKIIDRDYNAAINLALYKI